MSCALRSLVVLVLCAAAPAPAQERFFLPETPYDYATARSPYGKEMLGLRWSNPEDPDRHVDHRATLGRVLFYDRRLSRNGSVSCASCHEQAKGFADGRRRSTGFEGRETRRNSMSLANLRQHTAGFFWDERARTLEEMVLMPIQDPIEMGLDLGTLLERLRRDAAYRPLFARAFGSEEIEVFGIAEALAEFVRALVSLRSRYDQALALEDSPHGDFEQFSDAENRGRLLFFREGSCASCHMGQYSAGGCICVSVPDPFGFEGELATNNGVDIGKRRDDPGVGGATGRPEDTGCFRAPTLRNIELTAPYMHDGRFATLEAVLHFYAHRVRPHRNLDARMVTGHEALRDGYSVRKSANAEELSGVLGIELSPRDQADLVAFLKTLTDREFITDPRYSDPFVRPAATHVAQGR